MNKKTRDQALNYHAQGRPGKIEVVPSKPYSTQADLSLAYSPGVAEPCKEIEQDSELAYKYTAKSNLVGVISNGTAVLGLGDIGALAGKPVMEGKGLLFKVFADIDVFDIEIDRKDPKEVIETVKAIAPTFGGINLEDIKSPECFEIEEKLKEQLDIPIFHDDQHGTAIISGAGLLNALEINGKDIKKIKVVVCGAGAAAISCAKLYTRLGVKTANIYMVDSEGLITTNRGDVNEYQKEFAQNTNLTKLGEVIENADVFLGLSVANVLKKDMVQKMSKDPIVFALANPNPEISFADATSTRKDIIFATGRSDHPNQINNVLGFPYIFRGALDVRAKAINEEMKIAAVYALAELAKEDVPESVNMAYNTKNLSFGKEYIIPKPLDPRLITVVAPAVANAAMDSGVARIEIKDWKAYKISLMKKLGIYNQLVNDIHSKAIRNPKRILFGDAHHLKVLKAIQEVRNEGMAIPILLGKKDLIIQRAEDNNIDISDLELVDIYSKEMDETRERYADLYYQKRNRKGVNISESRKRMRDPNYFGAMMVETGEVDGFISGFSTKYADTIRPALEIIGTNNNLKHIAGMYIVMTKKGPLFFSDTTVNIMPDARTLVNTSVLTANTVRKFNIEPVMAMVSFSNFGSVNHGNPKEMSQAVKIMHSEYPEIAVDGEMQVNFALNKELRQSKFPFTKLGDKEVNTIIFPNLSSGNIAYKMMGELAETEIIGPILLGIKKPIHVLQMESSVREIVNMTAITVMDAQTTTDKIIEF